MPTDQLLSLERIRVEAFLQLEKRGIQPVVVKVRPDNWGKLVLIAQNAKRLAWAVFPDEGRELSLADYSLRYIIPAVTQLKEELCQ